MIMLSHFKKSCPFILAACGLAMLAVCQPVQAGPIRIGATVSHSGPYKATSSLMQEAFKLWARQVNARGGLLGRKVELLFYDDQSRVDRVRELYQTLILRDKVDLVFSPYGSPLTLAAAEVTEQNHYLLLASAASSPEIWTKGYQRVFGVYATADRYFIGFLDLLARKNLHSVAIGYENTAFAKSAAEGARVWSDRFGLRTDLFDAFEKGAPHFKTLLTRLKVIQPDALILCAYPHDIYAFMGLLAKFDYKPPNLAFTIAPALQEFYEKAGPGSEHVFGPSQWEPDERVPFPGTRKFIKDFVAYTGRRPSYHAGAAFASGQILERALGHVHSLDQNELTSFIRSLDTVTVIGRFKVDHTGRQIGHNPILIQWQQGKKQIVYPNKMRTAAPVLRQAPAN